jgi:hypothetical protein
MKICPTCGRAVSYNSYFKAFFCNECGWYEDYSTSQAFIKGIMIKKPKISQKQDSYCKPLQNF